MPLTVVCGPVFAGKSSTLYRYIWRALRSKKTVDVVVPQLDTRGNGQVVIHTSGMNLETLGVTPRVAECSRQVYSDLPKPHPSLLVIDEAQFFDLDLGLWVGRLLNQGLHVVAAGLDLTSEGVPFGEMGHLLCIASKVKKLKAICDCGRKASRSACVVEKTGTVLVGGTGKYVPMCLPCWQQHRHRTV